VTPRRLGFLIALVSLILDQANKLWLLFVYDIAARQPLHVTPFFDIVYARNPGISYSLLRANTDLGRWVLLASTFAATIFIAVWLWRAKTKIVAAGLGLIVGGALGNELDRLFLGAVSDFYYFHIGSFSWYIFNVADCAIVLGVALLLYDAFIPGADKDRRGKAANEEIASKSPRTEA